MESLGLDWKLLIAQMVNFGLLFFVLKKVLYKPLMKAIDERNKKIESAVKNSQEIALKLNKIEEQKKDLLDKAKTEARMEKEGLMEVALSEKEKIIEEAKLSAKREIEKGLLGIESAKKEAINSITDEYLQKVTEKLYDRFSSNTKKDNYPLMKSLLK
jgi:F-type H+-transporting ATPase subunit b